MTTTRRSSDRSSETRNHETGSTTRSIPGARTVPGAGALKGISDDALLSGIRKLSQRERRTVLSILVHLVEIDRRRLYLPMGSGSLYDFCVKHLGYSESQAVRRTRTARCMKDYPQIYGLLASGSVSISNVSKISKIISESNACKLLSDIEGRSAREVDLIVSSRRPESAIRDRVTPVYIKTLLEARSDPAGGDSCRGEGSGSDQEGSASPKGGKKTTANVGGKYPATSEGGSGDGCGEGPVASPDTGGRPFAERAFVLEERFKLTFGVDRGFLEKIDRIKALLSSKHHRDLDYEEFFSVLMDDYIERHSPEGRLRRKGKRERRKAGSAGRKASRYIPARVRDEVYARDRGRCTFLSRDGTRCASTRGLQVDHIVPFARGGDNSPSNLRLLCGKHNRLEAERAFGKKHMEQYVKEPGGLYLKEHAGKYTGDSAAPYLRNLRILCRVVSQPACGALPRRISGTRGAPP